MDRNSIRAEIQAAIDAAPARVGTEMPGKNGAEVFMVDILDATRISALLAAHNRGERGPLFLTVIDKYAPKGTEGWVYTVAKVNKKTVSLTPVGGGRGLTADPGTLAEVGADDLTRYLALRDKIGYEPQVELHTGSVVKLGGPRWVEPADALWVVIALKGMTEIAVARLGGEEGGRYFGKLPRTLVTSVIAPELLPLAMSADPRFTS